MSTNAPQRNKIFVSYAHQDKVFVERMKLFLEDLEPSFPGFEVWIDRSDMDSGDKWFGKIEDALAGARVAVLLFSHDFLFSSFIKTHELPRLMQAAESEGVTLLPVIVAGGSRFKDHPLNQYNAVNLGRELKTLDEAARDEVYTELQAAVRRRLLQGAPAAGVSAPVPTTAARPAAPAVVRPATAVPAAASPVTATPLVPGLQPALVALLDPRSGTVGVEVLSLDGDAQTVPLLSLDLADDELMLALPDQDTLAPLNLSPAARARLADDRYGSNRSLGPRSRHTVDSLKAEVARQLTGVYGLPNAQYAVTAEAFGPADDAQDQALVADLADNIHALLNPRKRGAWTLELLATDGSGDSCVLMWLDRLDDGELQCSLPNNAELPADLAISRDLRREMREEAGFAADADNGGRYALALGPVGDADPEGLVEATEEVLRQAYGLPRDDYSLSSALSRLPAG